MTVKKGDNIQVSNKDNVPHTVTNGKGPDDPNSGKLFDTSIINGGESTKVPTTKLTAGEYPYILSDPSLYDWDTKGTVEILLRIHH